MTRDIIVDRLRGFAMFWVIVVHVLYWADFFTDPYINLLKSFCLFEMPLFFFVTGASHSFRKINGYFRFIGRRFQRILIPYWIFAVICALLSIGKLGINGDMDFLTGVKIFLSWMIPVNRQITPVPYLTWALWFVPVYLCVITILPVLKQMKDSARKIEFAFLLTGIFVLTCFLKMGWVQNVAFYSFWTYVGLFYRDIKAAAEQKNTRRYFLYSATAGAAAVCILYLAGQTLNMQVNKFPPNIMFLVFSITMMSLILLLIPILENSAGGGKLSAKIFNLFSTRSMTIFLYQVFAFNLTIPLANMLVHGGGVIASIIKSVFCLATTLPICAGFAAILGRIEKLEIKHFESSV